MDYESLCKSAHKIGGSNSKLDAKKEERIKSGLDFLELNISPTETQSLARAVGLISFSFSLVLVLLLSLFAGFSPLWVLFMVFSSVLYLYAGRYPILKASEERKKAASQMPEVVSYLIMSLRITPNIERAIEFAGNHTLGLFHKRLKKIIWEVRTGRASAESGLGKLAEDFSDWSEFGRSIGLLISSNSEGSEESRQNTLDKASDVLLSGLVSRTEKQARALNTPVMIIFTFGVILPLIFVAIVPFMSLMGIAIGPFAIAVVYTIALPLLIYIAIRFIVSNRPMTLLPPQIPAESKDVGYLLISLGIGGAFALPLIGNALVVPMQYVPFLWIFGAAVGSFFVLSSRSQKNKRAEIKGVEEGFAESLHELSTLLAEGRPLESAMNSSKSKFFKSAANNIGTLNKGLTSSFFDKDTGSLKDVYSQTIKGAIETLVSVADKGSESMAQIGFKLSEHLINMKKCEDNIHQSLGSVVSSMRIIAMVVAPLVGGMISAMSVVLAKTVSKSQEANMSMGESSSAIDPNLITFIIGAYALESAIILVIFGTELLYGNDGVMKKYNVGIASIISVLIFTVCVWLSGGLFSGIA